MSVNEKMTALADAIRRKTGGTEKLGLDAMAAAVDDVYKAGAKSEWDKFWDIFQQNGEKANYNYAFYHLGWTDAIFRPKYDIRPTAGMSQTFASTGIADISGCLKKAGVVLDTSLVTSLSYTFNSDKIETLPVISAVSASALSYTFYNAANLHTIEKLILKDDGSQTFSNAFGMMSSLENIVIEGCIGNNVSFAQSTKLTHDSIMSIFNALKDYSADTSGTVYRVTLSSASKNKLSDTDKAVATQKGWTIA